MGLQVPVQPLMLAAVDCWLAAVPRPMPTAEQIASARLVAHRGAHGPRVLENTRAAFAAAVAAGVWGIELDVRFSRDGVPIVHHDADTRRVYGRDLRIADCTAEQLCGTIPQILTLAQVVAEFGRKVHLMIELKAQPGDPAAYAEILQRTLAPLDPVTDYHIISLDPVNTFRAVPFVPARALLPVAELRVARLSSMALDLGWGGLAGHVLVITDATIRRHHDAGQMVGTGFARSRNALWRELGRGVDWVFTDNALQMQTELQRAATASADLRVQ